MDPDLNLTMQRRIAREILAMWDHCQDDGTLTIPQQEAMCHAANELGELVEALDQWISKGGFLPTAWRR